MTNNEKTLPRKNSEYVKIVLADRRCTIHGKALKIRAYDQEMLSREYDRKKPAGMSIREIEEILKGLGYAE